MPILLGIINKQTKTSVFFGIQASKLSHLAKGGRLYGSKVFFTCQGCLAGETYKLGGRFQVEIVQIREREWSVQEATRPN